MTTMHVAVELEGVLLGSSNWVVQELKENTFATTFPSHAELRQMVLWGRVEVKCVHVKMEVKEKINKDIWRYEIPKCWVQFHGLSDNLLEETSIIWAVGSILDVTKMVDMSFTKQLCVARIWVVVLDPELVTDVV